MERWWCAKRRTTRRRMTVNWMTVNWITILLVIIAILPLTGCSLISPQRMTGQGSQLVLTALSDPKTFNYALISEFPSIGLFCYEGLTRENGQTGILEPALAESWEISADKLRVVFNLRQGLRWSDGEPLTVDDVVFTYNDVFLNPKIPSEPQDLLRIGRDRAFPQVSKLSDRQIEFRLPEPFAPLLRAVGNVAILPRHVLQSTVKTVRSDGNLAFLSTWGTDSDPSQVIVNGPYRMARFISGERLIFERNPYYWRKDQQGRSLPYIDRIIWQFIENTDTQLLRFRSGDLDVIGDVRPLRPEYFSLLKREEQRGNFRVYNGGPWSGVLYMTFNLNRGRNQANQPFVDPVKSRWFNNVAFRQAVAYAIDRTRMNNNIFRGLGIILNSPVSVQSPYFLTPAEGLPVYDYNPQRAKDLLLGAGFRYNPQGQLLDADGNLVRFSLITNAGNKVREAMGAQIKQDLAQIGIQVDFNPISFNSLLDTLGNRQWEAHMIGFTGDIDPNSNANLWSSSGGSHYFNLKQQAGGTPIQGWVQNDWERQIDDLLIAGARELDEAKRKAIYAQFQILAQQQVPVIMLVNDRALMAARNSVQGLRYSGLPSWGLWNIYQLRQVQ